MKRLSLLPLAVLVTGLLFAVACAGETVIETVIVEKQVPGEKVVETVIVEKQVPGEKVVETVIVEKQIPGEKVVETVVVEKEVEKVVIATATPAPRTFYGLTMPDTSDVTGTVPTPKSASGSVVIRGPLELRGSSVPGHYDGSVLAWSVHEKFFTTDKGGNAVPLLAESWTVADDLSYIDMKVKEGIQWHGGFGELTAEDVAFTINQGNPATNAESVVDGGGAWVAMIGPNLVTVIDTYTVRIPIVQFDVRWDSFMFGQSGLNLGMQSKVANTTKTEDWLLVNLIGTGPFEASEFVRDDHMTLERVATVHHDLPEVETLTIRGIPDDAVGAALLETGEVDIAERIPLRDYPKYTAMGFKVISAGAGSFHSITFAGNYWEQYDYQCSIGTAAAMCPDIADGTPTEVEVDRAAPVTHYLPWIGDPFRDSFGSPPEGFTSMTRAKQVRRALAMAYDRELINEVLFADAGWPYYTYGAAISNPNYDTKWNYDYDPVLAGQMLDEVGFSKNDKGIRMELPLFIRLGRGDEEIGTAVAGFWRELGIDVQEFRAQYQVFRPCLIARTCTSAWIHSAGVEGPQQPWDWPVYGNSHSTLSRPGGYNIGMEDAFLAETYLEMNAEPDKAKRILIRNRVVDYINEWAVSIGTIAVPNPALINPQKIESWDMPLSVREAALHHPENIKLVK